MSVKFPKNITQYQGEHEINGYSFSIPTITAEDKAFVKAAKRNKGVKSGYSQPLDTLIGDVILNGNMARLLWALDIMGCFQEPYFAWYSSDTIKNIFQCLVQKENDLPDDLLDKLKLIGKGPQSLYYIDKELDAVNQAELDAAENEAEAA